MSDERLPLLFGFSMSGYRSFATSTASLAKLSKVTLLAGQNNAGKSNVLRFLRDFLQVNPSAPSIELDRPLATLPMDWNVRMRLILPEFPKPRDLAQEHMTDEVQRILQRLASAPGIVDDSGIGFDYVLHKPPGQVTYPGREETWEWTRERGAIAEIATHLIEGGIQPMRAANILTGRDFYQGSDTNLVLEILNTISPDLGKLPAVRIIQAFRQIRPGDGSVEDVGLFDGVGLVSRLQQLESPKEIGAERDEARHKYDKINLFVRSILDDESATLHIPYDASTIQIQRGSSVLPLDSLGTGVHQVVMLAAAATLLENTVIGLEEPEVHLHPLLQRRLLRYLVQHTYNQYIIATHSAHMLDYELARVFHLTLTEAGTEVTPAGTPHEVARVCADLGYRPSDLLQSNAVIWVEGPSDRIYIRYWLDRLKGNLIEGIHYSIMFYGGGLLRHLTPDDPSRPGLAVQEHDQAVRDFISLRRLNRHLAIVIDSDKTSNRKRINATKTRVRDAFNREGGPGFAWVTHCYTFENYIPRQLLLDAVKAVHPRLTLISGAGDWENPLCFKDKSQPDKVTIARYVVEHWQSYPEPDSRFMKEIRSLVTMIHEANGDLISTLDPRSEEAR